ncbi:hypothetical protein [Leucobacter sp. M11]|uniref:hypothetical protein n=1 Tax=Leucobacter sp. M11 TaxID=2993565 RepID=UPI002D7E92A1|nr:hypothetical protein [Leucobacter sp. M11]MEB4614031.1 hypothetical protein [Leucobacter sp. M11]
MTPKMMTVFHECVVQLVEDPEYGTDWVTDAYAGVHGESLSAEDMDTLCSAIDAELTKIGAELRARYGIGAK